MSKKYLYLILAIIFFLAGTFLMQIGFYLGIQWRNMRTTSSFSIGGIVFQTEAVQIKPTWELFVGLALLLLSIVLIVVFIISARGSRT